MGLVDTVDEQQVRNALFVEHPKRRRDERGARRIGIDDDDGQIGSRDSARRVGGKADRSWRVDDREFLAQIGEIVEVGLGRSAAGACFLAAVADA